MPGSISNPTYSKECDHPNSCPRPASEMQRGHDSDLSAPIPSVPIGRDTGLQAEGKSTQGRAESLSLARSSSMEEIWMTFQYDDSMVGYDSQEQQFPCDSMASECSEPGRLMPGEQALTWDRITDILNVEPTKAPKASSKRPQGHAFEQESVLSTAPDVNECSTPNSQERVAELCHDMADGSLDDSGENEPAAKRAKCQEA